VASNCGIFILKKFKAKAQPMTKQPDQSALGAQAPHRQYRQSLGEQVNTVEQEARMVLPGIQALFGFQLIAVFNQGFKLSLSPFEQVLHLIALIMVAVAAIFVMAPAAYHREAEHQISKHFVELSSRFLAWSMLPFALGICLDIYLIAKVITASLEWSLGLAGAIFSLFAWTWFVFPKLRAHKIKQLPVHELPKQS
jgi:hypothetical protein